MALNTNIALGVQPVQQPNMLAQYAQIMGIKAAQQEMQGNEAVRAAYAQGGDLSDPEFRKRIMVANPQLGSKLVNQFSEMSARDVKTQADSLKAIKDSIGIVPGPAEMVDFLKGAYSTPGGALLSKLAPFEKAVANIPQDPKSFEEYKRKFSLSADKLFTSADAELRAKVNREGHGVQMRGQDMTDARAREQVEREQAELERIRKIVSGGTTSSATAPVTPMGGDARSSIFNPASANVLANQVAPLAAKPAPVNAFVNPPAGQTGAAPVANRVDEIKQQLTLLSKEVGPMANQAMERLIKEYNVLDPEGTIQQDASGALVTVNKRTNVATPVLDKNGKPVMGNSKYESAFTGAVGKSQAERNEKVVTAAQAASANIQKIDSAIELLKTGDTTTGLGAELRTNIDRARALFAGDIKAGKKVADTQILDALLGSDVFSMIQSLGIGARGLDTPAERDYLRQVMTGTIQMDNKALIRLSEIRRSIEVRAIDKYNTQLEKGELNKYFQTQGIKPEKIEVPKMAGSGNTVSVGGNTYTFPNAEAAAKFKKDAGIK
jgi:hypothetical protein